MENTTVAYIKFEAFTYMHALPILGISLFCLMYLYFARNKEKDQQFILGFYLSLLPFAAMVSRIVMEFYEGNFSLDDDLPLHLCRLASLVMPVFFLLKNEVWLKRMYFIILAGCLQAVITPELSFYHPHYSFWIYWIMHAVLIWLPVYVVAIMNVVPEWKDMKEAYAVTILYMFATLVINFALNSNYFYTRHKPPSASLLDHMGPWPWYLVSGAAIALVLFLLFFIPIYRKAKS